VKCAEMAELIDLLFGLWTWVGQRKHKFNRIRQVGPVCPPVRAHWRHLANTIELSVCGSDGALMSNYFDHLLTFVPIWLFCCLALYIADISSCSNQLLIVVMHSVASRGHGLLT